MQTESEFRKDFVARLKASQVLRRRELVSVGVLHGRYNAGYRDKLVDGGKQLIKRVWATSDGAIEIELHDGSVRTYSATHEVTAILEK
jgi:hypothetical protein